MMNKRFVSWPRLSIIIFFAFQSALVHSESQEFHYPELLVTPLATERIAMEADRESKEFNAWKDHSPILISSTLAILAAGSLASQKDDLPQNDRADAGDVSAIAFGVGAFWIGYSSYLAATYRPYSKAREELNHLSSDNPKQRLIKERLAEEKLLEAARFGRYLSWLSSGSLLISSVAIASLGEDNTEALGVAAAVSALSPLFFSYRWQKVSAYHSDYKKRIYGPIVTSAVYGRDNNWTPLLMVSSSF